MPNDRAAAGRGGKARPPSRLYRLAEEAAEAVERHLACRATKQPMDPAAIAFMAGPHDYDDIVTWVTEWPECMIREMASRGVIHWAVLGRDEWHLEVPDEMGEVVE